MKIKTLQWNIGGCKIRSVDADATLEESYSIDGIEQFCDVILRHNPDIVTLQETHVQDGYSQVAEIAATLNYPYFINDPYDQSHIDKNFQLGQGILSRFPLSDHTFTFYKNPRLEIIRPNGEHWITHDKGVTTVFADVEGKIIEIKTTHLVPFTKFQRSFGDADISDVLSDVDAKLSSQFDTLLLQGDFNYDSESLKGLLPTQFANGLQEVSQHDPTTPKGKRYDHVCFKGMDVVCSVVSSDTLTDHFPIITEFEFE